MSFHAEPADPYRPRFHFTPPEGWMNDPNGLVYYEGEYHLFYQYEQPRHWGHAVSADLLHWTHLPVALKPDDNGDIWSGSAMVDFSDTSGFFGGGSGLVAVFTHHLENRQCQSLAYSSDRGRSWAKYADNPVLTRSAPDFRDPKVFWHTPGKHWVLLLAAGKHLEFYTSSNLKEWVFASAFGGGAGVGVWECPDIYALPANGDPGSVKWILHASWINAPVFEEQSASRQRYFIGTFDGQTFTADNEDAAGRPLGDGRDDYAAITWGDGPDNRRILLGWMNDWAYADKLPTHPWLGAMTVPRELTLETRQDKLCLLQNPIKELETLRGEPLAWTEQRIAPDAVPAIPGKYETFEIVAELEVGTASEFGFHVRKQGEQQTTIAYDVASATLFLDRTLSGAVDFHSDFSRRISFPMPLEEGRLRLQILVDRCSVEVFGNGGAAYLSALIFPAPDSRELEIFSHGGAAFVKHLTIYPLTENKNTSDEAD